MGYLDLKYLKANSTWILKYSIIFCILGLVFGSYTIAISPNDYLQGIYAKIMYIHIPAAWLSLGLFVLISVSSIFYLSQRNLSWFLLAKSISVTGCTFTGITLVTGSIWGYPTWGAWWVWDARLTSMLLMFFIYIGYIVLTNISDDIHKSAKASSIFSLIGLINIPIIKFSVNMWNTLHQGVSVFKSTGPSIHISMLWPLFFSTVFFVALSCIIVFLSLMSELNLRKINRFQRNLIK